MAATALLAGFGSSPATAATPTLYELPPATHAEWLGVAGDGTVWFLPRRGDAWEGTGEALGRVGVDGAVGEVPLAGIAPASAPALAPRGALWLPYAEKAASGKTVSSVARLSPAGVVAARHVVGGEGLLGPLAVGRGAIWLGLDLHRRAAVEGIDAGDGSRLARVELRRNCRVTALVASGRSAWFGESCERDGPYGWQPHGASVDRIGPTGALVRHRLPTGEVPESLAIARSGALWYSSAEPDGRIGLVKPGGKRVEYRVPRAHPGSIAVGRRGRLWFPASFGGAYTRALQSIDTAGHLGTPICADPACKQEPSALTAGPDGGLWYALTEAPSLGGGGFTQIMEGEAIADEAGYVGHLTP